MATAWPFGSGSLLDFSSSSSSPAFVGLVATEASVYSVAFLGRVSDRLNCSSSQSFYIAEPSDLVCHTYCMWSRELGNHHGCVSIRTCHRFSCEGLSEIKIYQKQSDGKERVIAYASQSLNCTECNYDAHKLEFLALKWAVTDCFHEYLYGGTFDVFTDNNPLTYILTTAKLDAMGHRWVASLGPYHFKLHYKPGKLNSDADALSRIDWRSVMAEEPLV